MDRGTVLRRRPLTQPFSRSQKGCSRRGEGLGQNSILIDGALRFASPWKTASTLLPSGSSTKAA